MTVIEYSYFNYKTLKLFLDLTMDVFELIIYEKANPSRGGGAKPGVSRR